MRAAGVAADPEEVDDDGTTAGPNHTGGRGPTGKPRPRGQASRVLPTRRPGLLLCPCGEGGLLRRPACAGLRVQVESLLAPASPPAAAAAEVVWLEFRERLRAFVARRISNQADVDDVVQWVFLQMHRSLGEIRHHERVHAWLYSTARRAVADYYRSNARRWEVPAGDSLDLDGLTPPPNRGHDADGAAEVAACLAPVLGRLSPTDREAIVLTELQGRRLAEAAAVTGLSLSGMKSRVQRARRRLRETVLACCHVALDSRGQPMSCERRIPAVEPCCPGTA
jgi:RNA polymerase sigma-70 factor, ECF subfamily